MKEYFDKFKDLESVKEQDLPIDISLKVLWVDEDMLEGATLRGAMDKALPYLSQVPEEVTIDYCGQADAIDKLIENDYSLIILDNDAFKGRTEGMATLEKIKEFDADIPVIYTTEVPSQMGSFVKDNTKGIIKTHEIAKSLSDLIQKYVMEVK